MTSPRIKAYQRLKELLIETDSASYEWSESGKLVEWRQDVQNAFRRLLGDEREELKALNDISYSPFMAVRGTPRQGYSDAFHRGIKRARAMIRSAIREFEDYELPALDSAGQVASPPVSADSSTMPRKVFVVHGHDNEMKQEVARFLEGLDFEAVILHEQASGGNTIIEKFERNSDVSYAIVLLSPDDVGAPRDNREDLQPRPRQNVVLELGYFIGRLRRSRVCPIKRGTLEVPSDLHGLVYVPFEGQEWKLHLMKELKNLGFAVDANKAL